MIDVVVLAAGRGARMGARGEEVPKWLLEVGGATLAERHLEAIERAGRGLVRSVNVVVGHAAPAVAAFSRGRAGIALVENPAYAELNNWYSLLLALRALADTERVVVLNGDLLGHPDWFERFLRDSAAAATETLIAVDTARPVDDESMKVSADGGLLERIGKVGVEQPVGEYVGMFMARGDALRSLREALEGYVGSAESEDHWYEHAIGQTARAGVPWTIWPTSDGSWIEIDDEADYASALRMNGAR